MLNTTSLNSNNNRGQLLNNNTNLIQNNTNQINRNTQDIYRNFEILNNKSEQIVNNKEQINQNAQNIRVNAQNIQTNANRISVNNVNIGDLQTQIGQIQQGVNVKLTKEEPEPECPQPLNSVSSFTNTNNFMSIERQNPYRNNYAGNSNRDLSNFKNVCNNFSVEDMSSEKILSDCNKCMPPYMDRQFHTTY